MPGVRKQIGEWAKDKPSEVHTGMRHGQGGIVDDGVLTENEVQIEGPRGAFGTLRPPEPPLKLPQKEVQFGGWEGRLQEKCTVKVWGLIGRPADGLGAIQPACTDVRDSRRLGQELADMLEGGGRVAEVCSKCHQGVHGGGFPEAKSNSR